MKRAADTPDEKGKRAKRSLEFLGTCLSTLHLLSDGAAWRAAKAATASGDVEVLYIGECATSSTLCIQGSVAAPINSSKVAAAAHTHPFPGQAQVQLLVDTRSGELLDADTSCCPGGYHAARGSFCPCVGALLLVAAQLQSLEHGEHQELALAPWNGTDVVAARQHVNHTAGKLQQLVQLGLLQQTPAELLQVVEEVEVLPATHTQAKLKLNQYAGYHSSTASPDVITSLVADYLETGRNGSAGSLLANVACDLPQQEPDKDNSIAPALPPALHQLRLAPDAAAVAAALAGVPEAAYVPAATTAAAAAAEKASGNVQVAVGPLDHAQLLAALGGTHLTSYMGKVVPGWEQRPQVINWAFGLLLSAAAGTKSSTGSAAGSSSAAAAGPGNTSAIGDAKPLVAVTGLLRVLWSCIHVEGLPVELRGVLLVAMALRNLLLVVALPLWARKAVAAQLRAWQEGLVEAHTCNPVMHTGAVQLVHVLRVLKEAEQLCQHGWDHPCLSAALQSLGSGLGSAAADPKVADEEQQRQQQHPAGTSKQVLAEHPGLVLLRLGYLELIGEKAAYLDVAMAGQQWSHAVSALLRSGDRSQLRLAAELLPRHITSLSQRLDYMQQLLGLEELGVVERCELAARLLLSIRGDLVPRSQQPFIARSSSRAWWQVQMWGLRPGAGCGTERQTLQHKLGVFLKEFFKLAGQAQFHLAKEALASSDAAAAAQGFVAAVAAPAAAGGAAVKGSSATSAPGASVTTSTPATTIAISMQDARREVLRLPQQQQVDLFSLVQQSVHQRNKRCQDPLQLLASLQAKWGERMQPILKQLATLYGTSEQVKRLLASTVVEPVNGESPNSPLELDAVMLQHGEPSSRCKASSTATLELDDLGFVKAVTGPVGVDKVEPFPLPNLLPLCGLAPAALHAVVEGALAPVFDAAFRPSTASSSSGAASLPSSRPMDLGARLLQVAGHPGVEYGGAAVRLQLALEMVAYTAALTPLDSPDYDPLAAADRVLYQTLLYGLLAMGQRDLAWTVAKAAYRTCPGRFTATYILLLAIQRGTEAQAEAVDWILGRDWPQAAQEGEDGPVDLTGSSPQRSQAPASAADGDTSSLDTQQLLGSAAAAAVGLADTASSRAKQNPSYQAARARKRAAQQHVGADVAGGAAAGGGRPPANVYLYSVENTVRRYLEEARDYGAVVGFAGMVEELAGTTGLPLHVLEVALGDVRTALNRGEELIYMDDDDFYGYPSSDDYDMEEHYMGAEQVVDPRITAAVRAISRMAQDPHQQPVAAAPGRVPGVQGGTENAAQKQAASPPVPAATLVLEHELLGATGAAWRERAGVLRKIHLQPVIQYAAACGLHPDMVTRLALVELGGQPEGAATSAVTWEEWVAQSRKQQTIAPSVLTHWPQVLSAAGPQLLLVAPGVSIQVATDKYVAPLTSDISAFAAWLLHWLQGSTAARHGGRLASNAGPCRTAALLRQLWLLLDGHCHSTWMLWFAAALDRAGEQQLACEAAAQGLLPRSCSYVNISCTKREHASCLATVLPQLAKSGDPGILQQAAATQLLLAQAPVPVEVLLGEGVLQRLVEVTTQLVISCTQDKGPLQVPAMSMDLANGKLSFPSDPPKDKRPLVNACSTYFSLLQRCVFVPLGGHSTLLGHLLQQQALSAAASPGEDAVVTALEPAVTKLHWSTGLCIARAARAAGAIHSWPGLLRLLATPLAAAAEAFSLAVREDTRATCTTLVLWKCEKVLHLPPLVSKRMEEAGDWVNGVLAWITVELGAAILDKGKHATQPPPECVEQLSSCLLGFHSPHVMPYTAAALQVLQGHSAADITRALVPNGVLPLVGRPENLEGSTAAGGARSPYWAWGQTCYTQALHCLLQQGQLLASLPPATIRDMALTYWVKCGTLEAMAWVGQLLDWLQQRTTGRSRQGAAEAAGAGSGTSANPALQGAPGGAQQSAMHALDVLSIQVHPELAAYLDLAPASGPQAALQRFLQLQTAAARKDLQGALSALFREPREMLGADFVLSPAQYHNLEQQMMDLEGTFALLEEQPYAGSPAVSWLQQQPEFQHMRVLLRGLPPPSAMDTHIAALPSPLLRLRVVQLKLWKLSRAIRGGPPSFSARTTNGPPAPWKDRLTSVLLNSLPQPSYHAHAARWAQLADADVLAAFQAARSVIPGPSPLPRQQMLSNVLVWMQGQEVALAWAVVKYAELRGSPSAAVTVAELRALVQDPTQLGQLPVFMTQLGAAVKQQRPRYPLYALFRHCVVPREVHQYAWGTTKKRGRRTLEQLKQWLHGRYQNRLWLQQTMVQTMPWLDWQTSAKGGEVSALAEWLWWLAVGAQEQGVVGAHVATDQPARGGGFPSYVPPSYPYY